MTDYITVELHMIVVPDPELYDRVPPVYAGLRSDILDGFLLDCRNDSYPDYVYRGEFPHAIVPPEPRGDDGKPRNPEPEALREACNERLARYFEYAGPPSTDGVPWEEWHLDDASTLGLYYYDNGAITWCSGGMAIWDSQNAGRNQWIKSVTAYDVEGEIVVQPTHEAPPNGGRELFVLAADMRLGVRFAM